HFWPTVAAIGEAEITFSRMTLVKLSSLTRMRCGMQRGQKRRLCSSERTPFHHTPSNGTEHNINVRTVSAREKSVVEKKGSVYPVVIIGSGEACHAFRGGVTSVYRVES